MEDKKLIRTKTLTIEVEEFDDGTFTVMPYSKNMCDHEIVGVLELIKAATIQNFILQKGAFPGETKP